MLASQYSPFGYRQLLGLDDAFFYFVSDRSSRSAEAYLHVPLLAGTYLGRAAPVAQTSLSNRED